MKTAFVTGASGGIGEGIARLLLRDGFRVAAGFLSSELGISSLAREFGDLILPVCLDVSDRVQVEAAFALISRNFGDVDLLVNNAGVSHYGLFADVPEDEWRRVFDVNVGGVINCSQLAILTMVAKKSGSIINISSIWGMSGASCEAVYSASKAAVIGLTKSLALELGPSGIRMNCVAPGAIATKMLSGLTESDLQSIRETTPLGTIGTPEDVAELVCFLASDKARFITGQVISPNGGFLI